MTARRIIKKPRVETDLTHHFSTIARDKIAPAERFLLVAEQSFERLAAMPGIGRRWESDKPHLDGIRVYPMPARFRNYSIFYRADDQVLEVLAVLHGSRDLAALVESLVRDDQPSE